MAFNFNIRNPGATVPIRITLTGQFNVNAFAAPDALSREQVLSLERSRLGALLNTREIKTMFDDIGNAMNPPNPPRLFNRNRILFSLFEPNINAQDGVEQYPYVIDLPNNTYTQTLTYTVKAYPNPGIPFDVNDFTNRVIDKQGTLNNILNGPNFRIYDRGDRPQYFQGPPNVILQMNQAGGRKQVQRKRRKSRNTRRHTIKYQRKTKRSHHN
jgi:hypothetical protein